MEEEHLYKQIAEAVRQDIINEVLQPGDRLPSVRQMTSQWHCTPGTVQRAYQELSRQGLVVSRPGQGTHVIGKLSARSQTPLRRAELVHRAEAFLLEALTAGYTPDEIEQGLRLALDRWRVIEKHPQPESETTLRITGSHDLAVAWMSSHFSEQFPQYKLELDFCGSLGGLIALSEGKADLAGSHLWDSESDTYNRPFVRRILPGQKTALIHLVQRRLGLIMPAGNPLNIHSLMDLARPEIIFVNRQPGSGTRVWLDAHLDQMGISAATIRGYEDVKLSHSEVARCIAEGEANLGLGLEASALAFGLDFLPLALEEYHLVAFASQIERPAIQTLVEWLKTPAIRQSIASIGGYNTTHTGEIEMVA